MGLVDKEPTSASGAFHVTASLGAGQNEADAADAKSPKSIANLYVLAAATVKNDGTDIALA